MTDEDYDKIIEELEAELAEYKHVASAIDTQWAESQDEIADLKAQLAKAVKALECAKGYVESTSHGVLMAPHQPNIIKNKMKEIAEEDFASICTTLAELTGGNKDDN